MRVSIGNAQEEVGGKVSPPALPLPSLFPVHRRGTRAAERNTGKLCTEGFKSKEIY